MDTEYSDIIELPFQILVKAKILHSHSQNYQLKSSIPLSQSPSYYIPV